MGEIKTPEIITDPSVSTFLSECGPLLYRDEATNSLMLGLLEGVLNQTPVVEPLLVRIVEGGKNISAAVSFRKQPMNLILTYANELQLQLLAEHLLKTKEIFSGVVGPKRESEIFAHLWKKLTGRNFDLAMGQKIYKMDHVQFPPNMKGEMRVAKSDDLDLVFTWVKAFTNESLPGDKRSDQQWKEFVTNIIRKQGAHLWVHHESPVSMAIASRPTKSGISISGVYTPPEHRKNGYASAIVATVSHKMLNQGKKFCVLYTDVANPTSNKIYQEVGYREISESMHFNFI